MTSYARDPLEELWKDILEVHWRYLETEESMKKIDERKLLEGRLKEYISVVSHDRKFFLSETEQVLRKSITQMKDFSAFKGADGFESISHYANNLFTKPWRKEYRVIKMYSGFYQHEIKNNLMDAEKLFIAMGYKLLPNQTLVLDGPICPDQVTNVSRDALTAFVECQIMKQVNADLSSMGMATSWMEIFSFRECHIGDSSQTLKGLAQIIQARHNHMMRKDPFALAIPAPPLPPASSSHHHYQQQQHQVQQMCNSHCSLHPYNHNQAQPNSFCNPSSYSQPCSLHTQSNLLPPNGFYQPQHNLPHSKSLDQYDGKLPPNGTNQHRLSLDHSYKINPYLSTSHQQSVAIAPPFDCIDSVAFNHPYNQPNARSPLPYNLSSNLGHHMTQEQYYPTAIHINYPRMCESDHYHQQMLQQQIPTPVSDYHQKSCEFTDSSLPVMPENELISFGNELGSRSKPAEVKLRSSLKKNTHTMYDSIDMEQELNDLRALKRTKPIAQANINSDVKARDGIGNYQAWDYVFQNLEKETSKKNMAGNHDDKVAAELQLENLKISNGHIPKLHQKNNGAPPRISETSIRPSSGNQTSSVQTKTRTKSVSTGMETSYNEHKRTSSVMEISSRSNNNVQKHKPPQQPQIVVPPGEWSCRFCTFLNPDSKKICDMCSKSKDFFLDADKNPTTATCV